MDFLLEPNPNQEIYRIIWEKLLEVGWAGTSVANFSKWDSNVLVSHHHSVDYNIELTTKNLLYTSPLYSILLE